MTTFDERERAAEARYALDEANAFKAGARRNKLVGLWAAAKLGKTGADADAYAREVVAADFTEKGDEDVFRKLRGDLDPATVGDTEIRRMMSELLAQAVASVRAGA